MKSGFKLEIVTPDKNFFDEEVEMAIVRTSEGDIGIMKDHEPLVAPLAIGGIRVRQAGEFRDAACSSGFITIDEDKVMIITDSAEWAHEIDLDRAKEAADRANRRLENRQDELDVLRAKISLKKAMNRINIHTK